MSYYKQIVEKTGTRIRATAHINTDKEGVEEWRAVVDTGELPPITKKAFRNKNGRVVAEELIRRLKPSYQYYRVLIKDSSIISCDLIENRWTPRKKYPKKTVGKEN